MKHELFNNGREKWVRFQGLKLEINLTYAKELNWEEFDEMYMGKIPHARDIYEFIQTIQLDEVEQVKEVEEVPVVEVAKPKKGKKKLK